MNAMIAKTYRFVVLSMVFIGCFSYAQGMESREGGSGEGTSSGTSTITSNIPANIKMVIQWIDLMKLAEDQNAQFARTGMAGSIQSLLGLTDYVFNNNISTDDLINVPDGGALHEAIRRKSWAAIKHMLNHPKVTSDKQVLKSLLGQKDNTGKMVPEKIESTDMPGEVIGLILDRLTDVV